MKQGRQRGFTMIEVILFLGVSGLLLLIAFTFTASSIRNARFSDSTKSLENFLKEQYTRVQTNGITLSTPNLTPQCSANGDITTTTTTSNTGTSQTCILLGAAIDVMRSATTYANPGANSNGYNGRMLRVSPVLGYAPNSDNSLREANPRVWLDAAETHDLSWQATVNTAAFRLSPNTVFYPNRFILLRDTTSERINLFSTAAYNTATSSYTNLGYLYDDFTSSVSTYRNVPTLLCVKSDDGGNLRGAVRINGDGRQQGTSIDSITSSVVSASESFFTNIWSEGLRCNT